MLMKKLFLILNIVFMALIVAGTACYCVFELEKIKVLTGIAVVLIGALNLFYAFMSKSENKKLSISMLSGFVVSFVASLLVNIELDRTMSINYSVSSTFFALSIVAYVVALVLHTGFKWTDLLYVGAIFIPIALIMTLSPLFGFSGAFVTILNLVFMLIVSCFVGKAFANLVSKQNANNILIFIASVFGLIFSFLFVLYKFAYLSNVFIYIILGTYYVSQILLVYVTFNSVGGEKSKTESNEKTEMEILKHPAKLGLKKAILYSISLCLAVLVAGYALSASFVNFNVSNAKMTKSEFLSAVGDDLNIPLIEINTEGSSLPHDKDNYVNCSFEISNCENEEDNFKIKMADNYGDENSVGIRLRGNSTFIQKKKPYRIKFDEKQSLFGLKKNKSWVLLADYLDQSKIRNYTAFSIANGIIDTLPEEDQYFAPTGHHVALVINGQYKGLFLLCEQMDENSGRANVKDDKAFEDISSQTDFPFFVEMDAKAFLEGKTGVDNFYIDSVSGFQSVEIKYPELDERGATENSDKVFDYIYEYMNAVCKLIKDGGATTVSFRENPVSLDDLVDINSFVDYYLVNEIMLNEDSKWKSIYFSKTTDGLLKIGPVWDFDFSMAEGFELPYDKSYIETANNLHIARGSTIFYNLFENESFYTAVAVRFDEIKHVILEVAEDLKTYKEKIDAVALIDAELWYGKTGEFQFDMQYDYVRLYLQDRYTYLDTVFDKSFADFWKI